MHDDNKIYAQVLLLDNKIENWKICQDMKYGVYDWKAYWKSNRMNDYTMETEVFYNDDIENDPEGKLFNRKVYAALAPQWINQWEYADDYKLQKCKIQTVEEAEEDERNLMEQIGKSMGRNLEFVRRLG
jgi:hypothetical protein